MNRERERENTDSTHKKEGKGRRGNINQKKIK
jgi:hypothetical protein